jgi:iron complex transport system substrate-binding protein
MQDANQNQRKHTAAQAGAGTENTNMRDNVSGSGQDLRRRSFLWAAMASPLALTGCLGHQDSAAGPLETAAFPVTLDHAFGSTTVAGPPKRIATLGYASQDVCIALGVVPVGVPQYEQRGFGVSLWFNKAVTTMNAVMPAQYRDGEEPPYDVLRNLKPDLILAVNSGITRGQYDRLQEIAPVVGYPEAPFATPWRTTTTMVGKALGRPKASQELIAEVEEGIAKARSSYDELPGATFMYLGVSLAPGADIEVYGKDSNPSAILQDFGVVPAPALAKVVEEGRPKQVPAGTGPTLWEARRAGELEADIHVAAVGFDKKLVKKDGILDGLPDAGLVQPVLLATADDALALVEASPLGVKWATLTVLPELARAAYESRKGA